MQIEVTDLAKGLRPSPTITMNSIALKMIKEGKKLYNFGIGEMNPQIPVPQPIKDAMKKALDDNETYYNPAAGDQELLQAISDDLRDNFGMKYGTDQIVVCPGPKDAFTKACMALLSPLASRNQVLTWAPVYESFSNMPFFFTGRNSVIMETDENSLPNIQQLKEYLENNNEKVAFVIINSPNNPSGVVYPESLIREIASILGKYPKIAIFSDEVYRTMTFDGYKHFSIAPLLPNQTFVFGGMSKEVSGTGLRLGWIAGPAEIVSTITNIQGNCTACCSLPTQKAYAKFLQQDKDMKMRMQIREEIDLRRNAFLKKFDQLEGLKDFVYRRPQGAFYFFPDIRKYFGRTSPKDGKVIETDEDLALYLLHHGNVVTIPGSKFEKPGYLRIAYASSSVATIEEGCDSMSKALLELK